ncbi:hypothetical protein ALQ48_200083 [Pseudomonas coronafaciens pv. zizaniae]|nr:hypothetical protein ALQ48_200083 [Pseudomonas coronafaciens pv. zizaniae]
MGRRQVGTWVNSASAVTLRGHQGAGRNWTDHPDQLGDLGIAVVLDDLCCKTKRVRIDSHGGRSRLMKIKSTVTATTCNPYQASVVGFTRGHKTSPERREGPRAAFKRGTP